MRAEHLVDHVRGATFVADARVVLVGGVPSVTRIELPMGARIYSYTLSADSILDTIPDFVAHWKLQDSELDLPSHGCRVASIHADIPRDVAFPASSKLIAEPGSFAVLHITYGQCT